MIGNLSRISTCDWIYLSISLSNLIYHVIYHQEESRTPYHTVWDVLGLVLSGNPCGLWVWVRVGPGVPVGYPCYSLTVTGELQLMTTTTLTLPDATIVQRAGEKNFHISYPKQHTHSLHGPLSISDDCQWIVGAYHDCWIPSHNQNFISSSFSGDRVCLGYGSGDVIIFDMKLPHK